MPHQIWIAFLLVQYAVHPLQNAGVDVSGHVAEIGRNISFNQSTVNLPLFMIHLIHQPDPAGNGDFIPCRRRLYDGSQLFRAGAYRVFDVFLEDGVEFIIVYDSFTCKTHNQAPVFRLGDVVDFQQMSQQQAVILLSHPPKAGEG